MPLYSLRLRIFTMILSILAIFISATVSSASDLDRIRQVGELRQLGFPYSNFVTGHGDGLDVEIIRRFASHLGVRYRFVKTTPDRMFGELTGRMVVPQGDNIVVVGRTAIKGDVMANGLTELAWRKKIMAYSTPTFLTQIWCIARADLAADPIRSTGNIREDIQTVRKLLKGKRILGITISSLNPALYGITDKMAVIVDFKGSINDIAPAIIKGEADVALLDVPDALTALGKWPGKLKVLGPLSSRQYMGAAFRKDSQELLDAFNTFFSELKQSGEYSRLVRQYFPAVFEYYPDFFGE